MDVIRQSGPEILGRSLAACMHPYAAWRVLPRSARLLLLTAYVGAGYLAVLAVLLFSGAN